MFFLVLACHQPVLYGFDPNYQAAPTTPSPCFMRLKTWWGGSVGGGVASCPIGPLSESNQQNQWTIVIYKRWKFRKKRLGISQYSDCQMSRLQAHNLAWIPYSRNCFIISTEPQICLKIQEDVIGCTVEVKIVLGSITQELFQSFYNQESLVMFAH